VLEKLRDNPEDRDGILNAINFSIAYQDEPLFRNVAETLAAERTGDAAVQSNLGDAYSYFGNWAGAEQAYRASLKVEDNEAVREQLARVLLKQDRPDDARPYLRHIAASAKRNAAGLLYLLVAYYQKQGRHREALEVIEERDQAFPEFAASKEYQLQRKNSTRYRDSDKRIFSPAISKSGASYNEGSWTARAPGWIAASIFLGLIALYLGSAFWIGQNRKVYLVNGTNQPYSVVVHGGTYNLLPQSATPIRVPEGDVQVAFANASPWLKPVQCHIETSFWGRPFAGHTFVINPDLSALVLEEEAYYAELNPRQPEAPKLHYGNGFHELPGVDYEFADFPRTLEVKGHAEIRKTRVALPFPPLAPEVRLTLVQKLDPAVQTQVCETVLQLDPGNSLMLFWLATRLPPEEVIKFVEPRLDDKPLLVDWHRIYQGQMERTHPETDLLPRYRKLLADTKGQADALYLLGRADPDPDAGGKLMEQAATATPPSAYGMYSLAYRYLAGGQFADARRWADKALPLMPEKISAGELKHNAMLANGEYDQLLVDLQVEAQQTGHKLSAATQMMRVFAARGDKAKARQKVVEAIQIAPQEQREAFRKSLEALLCCYEQDVTGYLKAVGETPLFETAVLRGQLKQAAELANSQGDEKGMAHGILYLAAKRAGNKELADSQWRALLASLSKGDNSERLFGEMLAGKKKFPAGLEQRLPIDPGTKRVLLAVLAEHDPDQRVQALQLAKRLNFQRDAVAMCLGKFLQ
jgi:tetratricopeptide (TPR) repeat protein